jgi:hypothetical protein
MPFRPSDKLDDRQVLEIINDIIKFGDIVYGSHTKQQMLRRGYSLKDVECILLHGRIVQREFDGDRRNWKYTIQGEDLEGDPGAVVAAIIASRTLFLITVLGEVRENE